MGRKRIQGSFNNYGNSNLRKQIEGLITKHKGRLLKGKYWGIFTRFSIPESELEAFHAERLEVRLTSYHVGFPSPRVSG
jgi:hypothetical protein